MKTAKLSSLLICVSFFLILLIPPFISDKKGGSVSVDENRTLSTFPVFSDSKTYITKISRDSFENWLKDNLGGRKAVIKIMKILNYHLFGELGFPGYRVISGPNKWLFYAPDQEIPLIVNSNNPDPAQLEQIRNGLINISKSCKQQGIELVVAIWPFKFNVYPEQLPSSLSPITSRNVIEVLDSEFTGMKEFAYVSPYKELIESKALFPTYSKANDIGHWNEFGAFIGYTSLINGVKSRIPSTPILEESDFLIKEVEKDTRVYWGFSTSERDLVYEPKVSRRAKPNISFFDDIKFNSKDPWKSYTYYENQNTTLPRALIVGDSYTWKYLMPNIAESFSKVVFIHYLDSDQMDNIISILDPDVLILAGQGYYSFLTFSQLQIN